MQRIYRDPTEAELDQIVECRNEASQIINGDRVRYERVGRQIFRVTAESREPLQIAVDGNEFVFMYDVEFRVPRAWFRTIKGKTA